MGMGSMDSEYAEDFDGTTQSYSLGSQHLETVSDDDRAGHSDSDSSHDGGGVDDIHQAKTSL